MSNKTFNTEQIIVKLSEIEVLCVGRARRSPKLCAWRIYPSRRITAGGMNTTEARR